LFFGASLINKICLFQPLKHKVTTLKIVTVVGARPQFVKAAVLSRAFRNFALEGKDKIQEIILHTGQHYDANMSDVFFDEMEIPKPQINLGIGGGSHGQNTGRMIECIEQVLLQEKPQCLLVYGDTDSTLAGAIAAAKLHIPVAHVEAGLRSFNKKMPEELNRIATDHFSEFLFTPTTTATHNLSTEGITGEKVVQVGDVMYDAALYYKPKAQKPATIQDDTPFILCTIHRAENTDQLHRLECIFKALNQLANNTPVVVPIHPRTRKILVSSSIDVKNILLVDPVGYFEMIWLLEHCELVVTDSGGLQKEAFFFNKQCVTVRNETEWVELIEAGANTLVDADQEEILKICAKSNRKFDVLDSTLYGSGNAGGSIVQHLYNYFM